MSNLSDVAEAVATKADSEAAMVITTGDGTSDIGGYIDDEEIDCHPIEPSLWMLALHIHHIHQTANASGGDASFQEIIEDALARLNRSYEVSADEV